MEERMESTAKALELMTAKIEALGVEAEQLCKRHFDLVMAENKNKDWENRSALYPVTRVRGFGLTANWYEVKWYGNKAAGTRRMNKKLIHKPKAGHSYTLAKLESHSQPWEVDMVREVEAGLAEIRRKAAIVSKALSLLNQLNRLESE